MLTKLRLAPCLALLCSACATEPREPSLAAPCPEPELAPASAIDESEREAKIDALARRARELYEVPGLAIAVVHEGELVFVRGYGERELGSGGLVDERTSFQIASNTKAFVATAVGLLVADGELGWDDPVHEHLPDLVLWSEQATADLRVRDLLSHRAGLATWAGDLMWISSDIGRDELLARLRYLPAAASLRERYGYSNLMFVVAGELIAAKTGQPWDAFVRARLLEPLGMDAVATRLAELEGRDNLAAPHIEVEGQWQVIDRLDIGVTGAAGALDASVLDISKWLRMQLAEGEFEGEQVVPAEIIHDTRTPHIFIPVRADDYYEPPRHLRAYGLGWSLEDYRGRLLVAHGGGLPGMTSRVLMVPEAELGIVVLTNSESRASALLALSVADLFLAAEPGKDYLAAFAPSSDEGDAEHPAAAEGEAGKQAPATVPLPAKLEGSYTNPMLGAAKIEAEAGGLWFFAHEHGGLRCRFAEQARPGPSDTSVRVPCTWLDPNMGVSVFTIDVAQPRKPELRFRVRPDFYDPLEYTFRAGKH
jgi:CubicO group peptidase (beta-lactamase class C family)